jgi:hypothetical protein
MRQLFLVAVLLLSILVPVLKSQPAYACSCVSFSTGEYVDMADAVVIGTVEEVVHATPRSGGLMSSMDPATVSVTVDQYLKGSGDERIEFVTARSGASCGAVEAISLNEQNVLFLRSDGDGYRTSLCAGNRPVSLVRDGQPIRPEFLSDVQAITGPGVGPGEAPAPAVIAEPGMSAWLPWLIAGVASAVSLAVGAAVVIRRLSR